MLGLFRLETGGRSWNRLHGHLSSQSDSTSGLAGWDADDVRTWPLVTGDPVVDARESEWQREWARTHDPDGLARYYSQYQRQAPPRQVPPRQRQSYVPPQQRVSFRPAGYADAKGLRRACASIATCAASTCTALTWRDAWAAATWAVCDRPAQRRHVGVQS